MKPNLIKNNDLGKFFICLNDSLSESQILNDYVDVTDFLYLKKSRFIIMTRDLKRDAEMYDKHSVKSFNPLNPCLIAGKRDSE